MISRLAVVCRRLCRWISAGSPIFRASVLNRVFRVLFAVIVAVDGYENHVVSIPTVALFRLLRVLTPLVFPEQREQ